MDYAFAPGTSGYDDQMKRMLTNRPNTTLINRKQIKHVAAFIGHLDKDPSIPAPIGDLLIASHGNDTGWMQIDLDGKREVSTTYEVLESAVESGSVRIPDSLRRKPDGTLVPISVHIRGCRIGQSQPFMKKLKEAFGGADKVTAPKHFHWVWPLGNFDGMFEYLSYQFHLHRPTKFAKRADVLEAFSAEGCTFINDEAVPDDMWEQWVPKDVGRPKQDIWVYVDLGTTIGKQSRLRIQRQFLHRTGNTPLKLNWRKTHLLARTNA